jgi:hypothetical protein
MPPLRPLLALAGPCLLLIACLSTGAEEPTAPPPEPPPPVEQPPPEDLEGAMAHFLDDPAVVASLQAELDAEAEALAQRLAAHGPADPARVASLLEQQVEARLFDWVAKDRSQPLPVDAERIRRQAIQWESWRLERYVSAGVFPKTYFGFFDRAWDTARHEETMLETVGCTRRIINAWQEERERPVRVTDAEIAVTFIAEGGALLLTSQQAHMDDLHPVFDVGLDDIASGLGEYGGLLDRLDGSCGTELRGTVALTEPGERPAGATQRLMAPAGHDAWLVRNATFREGIVGTALMWIWEKEIAARKLVAADREPMHSRPLDQQFVIGSLVYNSGIVHAESTAQSILRFETGARLHRDSENNAHRRPRLNLLPPGQLLAEILDAGAYRRQPTSWLASYHVLQRYGAWEGLRLFADVFDEGGMVILPPSSIETFVP